MRRLYWAPRPGGTRRTRLGLPSRRRERGWVIEVHSDAHLDGRELFTHVQRYAVATSDVRATPA